MAPPPIHPEASIRPAGAPGAGARPVQAAVALGSNLGDRARFIAAALAALDRVPGVEVLRASRVVETAPVRVGEAAPGGAYLNAAAVVSTTLTPRALLDALHAVEADLGRDRATMAHGAPRTIDLDLLLYGDERHTDEAGLVVPHPDMHRREFVLRPLAEVAPGMTVPGLGTTVAGLLAALGAPGGHRSEP